MSQPKILLYLHHVELGQRYPISNQEVVIGRSQGQILFPKDDRMSPQHCRITITPTGIMIADLGSQNGTVLDGRILSPQKTYRIRDGNQISIGGQVFKCVEPSPTRHLKHQKRRKKRAPKKNGFDFSMMFALLLLAGVGYYFFVNPSVNFNFNFKPKQDRVASPELQSPFELVYKEARTVYDEYTDIGRAFREERISKTELPTVLRTKLIPKFQAVKAKLSVLKPTDNLEKQRITANMNLVNAAIQQMNIMAKHTEGTSAELDSQLETANNELVKASDEARRINERAPAAQ
ncbi:MAG: FHA domain-containing protein [Bdellovibrionales bacterium]